MLNFISLLAISLIATLALAAPTVWSPNSTVVLCDPGHVTKTGETLECERVGVDEFEHLPKDCESIDQIKIDWRITGDVFSVDRTSARPGTERLGDLRPHETCLLPRAISAQCSAATRTFTIWPSTGELVCDGTSRVGLSL